MVVVSVLVGVGVCAPGARGGDDGGVGGGEFVERARLECGAEVVIDSDARFSGEGIEVWGVLWGGSAIERGDERGAALVAMRALLYELAERDPGALALTGATVEGLDSGEEDGVMALRTALALSMTAATREDVDRALGVCAEIARGGGVGDGSIDRAIASVRASIERRASEQVGMHRRASWLKQLMGDSSMAKLPVPAVEDFEGVTRESVRRYMGRAWRAGAMSVVVVGDIDADAAVGSARRAMGDVVKDPRGAIGGAIGGVDTGAPDVAGRVATAHDARLDGTEIGLVWFGRNTIEVMDEGTLDELMTIALAGEAMRSRVNRVVRAEIGSVTTAGVQVGDITPEARFAQMVVQMEGDGWEEALRALMIERTRLVRDGVGGEELERARAALTQKLSTEREMWMRSTAEDRAHAIVWLMSAGRPMVDLGDLLGDGSECVARVSEAEVHAMIRSLIGGRDPGVVVVVDSVEGAREEAIRRVVREASGVDPEPIGARWASAMAGSIAENIRAGGRVEEIRSHGASGVVEARLSNGIWARHRSMRGVGGAGDAATLAVHVGFAESPGESMDGVTDVIARAIEGATIRSRLDPEMRALLSEYGLRVRVEHSVRSVMIEITGPGSSLGRAAELAYALLMDLRIDASLVDAVRDEAARGEISVGVSRSAIEVGIARAMGYDPGRRSGRALGSGVDARSALGFWRDRVRDGLVEVGIVTSGDAESALREVAPVLGAVVDNEHDGRRAQEIADPAARRGVVRVVDPSGRTGVAMGFSSGDSGDLESVRTLVVGSMILGKRVEREAEAMGLGDGAYGALVLSDVTPGRAYVAARVGCDAADSARALEMIGEAMSRLADEGATAEELGWAKERIARALERTADDPSYWARRLALLGVFGQGVESLWSIGEDYEAITLGEVDEAMGTWYARGAHFSIEFVEPE
jgi:predicted Zn-dependent peptidase